VGYAYRWLAEMLFGLPRDEWRDDLLLLLIYVSCYGIQCGLQRVLLWASSKNIQEEPMPDAEPLVEKN
jgi:hypothetical protein